MDENKQTTNLGRGTRRGEYCASGVPAEVVLFWKPATLAILARREASSSLLHEPPLLGAAPPTHLMEWGSLHLNCYGPNECGCVTKSMPNPLREGGPPCALGLKGRGPTEEKPKRGRKSDGISDARVHGMLHVLTKVWEALRRLIKEVQKGAPTEGATALKPHPDALATLMVIIATSFIHAVCGPPLKREAGNAPQFVVHL